LVQQTSLARLTVVAQNVRVITPCITVGVRLSTGGSSSPVGRGHISKLTVGRWLAATRLNRRQVLIIKLVNSFANIFVRKSRTNFAVNQTTPDLFPVLGAINSLLQPVGVVPQPVLLVSSARDDFSGTLVGDDESEDSEAKQYDDQEKHDQQIGPE